MPYLSDAEYNKLIKRIEALEKKTSGIQNTPVVIGYPSKRLVLNAHLDALKLNNSITAITRSIALIADRENGILPISDEVRWHKVGTEIILETYNEEFERWDNSGTSFLL